MTARMSSGANDPKHWTNRIIIGDTRGLSQPPAWLAESYAEFRKQVTHPAFPCYFGSIAEKKREMFYTYVEGRDLSTLPITMRQFARLSASIEDERNNLAVFFQPEAEVEEHEQFRGFCWSVLQFLHDHDDDSEILNQPLPDDPSWEFSFAGMEMFAVGCGPSYKRRRSRNLGPGMMMLFQPRSVFMDPLTGNPISLEARQRVRERLLKWDEGVPAHPDTGIYGDPKNREWKQYFLPDTDLPEMGKCPFLSRASSRQVSTSSGNAAAKKEPLPADEGEGGAGAVALLDALERAASDFPDKVALRFLPDGETVETELTYGALAQWSHQVGAWLQTKAASGDRVVLALPSGPEYVAAFLGCAYARLVAVPVFSPDEGNNEHRLRLKGIIEDCAPAAVIVPDGIAERDLTLLSDVPHLAVPPYRPGQEPSSLARTPGVAEDTLLFLQYTSGSTGSPKGVMVTHGCLRANAAIIHTATGMQAATVMVTWLPLYHDMGLIGCILSPLIAGAEIVLMPTRAFVTRPVRWLRAISRYRGTISGGPDFAYRLCCDRIGDDQRGALDLSSWSVAFCGAEPVRPDTVYDFTDRFGACGLRHNAFFPCYGLAEATLLISGSTTDRDDVVGHFAGDALARGEAAPAHDGSPIVCCGKVMEGVQVRIVDPDRMVGLPDGVIGEIWAAGPSIALGYWNRSRDTKRVFQQSLAGDERHYLRTGDLGFLMDGRLFVTGRLKDLIILRGHNVYPQDVEERIETRVAGVRKGRCSVFKVDGVAGEGVGVACEVNRTLFRKLGAEAIAQEIVDAVSAQLDEPPALCLLLDSGDLPRTTSGKKKRSGCLEDWKAGQIAPLFVHEQQAVTESAPDASDRQHAEEVVIEAWTRVLGRRPASDTDDFYAVGGNSLKFAELAATLEDLTGRSIPLDAFFRVRDIKRQTDLVQTILSTSAGPQNSGARVSVAPELSRLTPPQAALWFEWQRAPQSSAYTVSVVLTCDAPPDTDALRVAIEGLLARHSVFRTCFRETGTGQVVPAVADRGGYTFREVAGDNDEDAREQVKQWLDSPFDLLKDACFRAAVITLASGKALLGFAAPHIVMDGLSASLVLEELSSLYTAAITHQTPDLKPAADYYQVWQDRLSDPRTLASRKDDLAFWKRDLESRLPERELTIDVFSDTDPAPSCAGHVELALGEVLSFRVSEAARKMGVTPSTLFLSALLVTAARWWGVNTPGVGVIASGRTDVLSAGCVGPFITQLPLLQRLDPSWTASELCEHVDGHLRDVLAHQNVSLSEIMGTIDRPRHQPLTQIAFNDLSELALDRMEFGGIGIDAADVQAGEGQFPLSLCMQRDVSGWKAGFNFQNIWRGTAETDTFVQGWKAAVEFLTDAARSRSRVGTLALFRQCQGDHETRSFVPVIEQIDARTKATPDAPAVICDNTSVTYAALQAASDRLGSRLSRAGAGVDQRVGLCVSRSTDVIVGVLGVLRAGAAYVPLDVTYPHKRLGFMIADSGLRHIVVDGETERQLGSLLEGLDVIRIDEAVGGENPVSSRVPPHPGQLAYVTYTSGSTGLPKGVGVSQLALSSHVADYAARFDIEPADTVLQFSSLGFDASVEQIFATLCQGATLVLRGDAVPTGTELRTMLSRHDVSIAYLPVAYFRQVAAELAGSVPSLRLMLTGAETLTGNTVGLWQDAGSVPLYNTYGPTETTVTATAYLTSAADGRSSAVAIGEPLASRSVVVMSSDGMPVRPGARGELCIGGQTLARGYLGRPSLTAERFVPDESGVGTRLYRTGDCCSLRPDGTLAFWGRLDQQVKHHGFRIEPGEIETALRAVEGVSDAAVVVTAQSGRDLLVAFVCGENLNGEDIREAVALTLPAWMVPAQVVVLDVLPLSQNGKTDRRALASHPLPEKTASSRDARTDEEHLLLGVFRAVLGREYLGIEDNFFGLGGDSISALEVASRLKHQGREVSVNQIFQHPTVLSLAPFIAQNTRETLGETHQPLPLTPVQSAFFENHPWAPAHWNQSVTLDRDADWLTAHHLRSALLNLVQRHDALRLRFHRDGDNGWYQQVTAFTPYDILWEQDLAATGAEWRTVLEEAEAKIEASFSLTEGPLFRAGWFALPDGSVRILIAAHHLCVDGVSWRIILRDLHTMLKNGRETGGHDTDAAPSTSWSAWVSQLERRVGVLRTDEDLAWWKDYLSGVEASLPVDQTGDRRIAVSETIQWQAARALTSRMQEVAPRVFRLGVQDMLLATLAHVIGAWCQREEVFVEIESHGRETQTDGPDLSDTVGWFTTRYGVRLPADAETPRDALISARNARELMPERALKLGLLQYMADPEIRTAARSLPRADISFNFLGRFDQELTKDGDGASSAILKLTEGVGQASTDGRGDLEHTLDINALIQDGQLSISWRYSPSATSRTLIETLTTRFAEELERLITWCETAPDERIAADVPLSGLTQQELEALDLTRSEIEDIYRATPLQEGLVLHSQMEAGAYVNQLRLTLSGAIDERRLHASWDEIVASYPALRTFFPNTNGASAQQCVMDKVSIPWITQDWRDVPASEQEKRLQAWLAADRAEPLSLAHSPLFRLALLRLDGQTAMLVFTFHHAILDGWSLALVIEDFLRRYESKSRGAATSTVVDTGYRDLVIRRYVEQDDALWWTSRLSALEEPTILADVLGRPRHGLSGRSSKKTILSSEMTENLAGFAARHGLTATTLFYGLWSLLLARYADRQQVTFGMTVSGRSEALRNEKAVVGLCINTVPLVVTIAPDQTIEEWLTVLQAHIQECVAHGLASLSTLQRMGPVSGQPLFDTLVAVDNYPMNAGSWQSTGGLSITDADVVEHAHYPVVLSIVPGQKTELRWSFDDGKIDPAASQALAGTYLELLYALASLQDSDDVPVPEFARTGAGNRLITEAFPFVPVLDRVATVTKARFADTAITFNDEQVTYGCLEGWSSRIGQRLHHMGVGADERIGLCVDRSPTMIAGMLGILRAGGAYVPLDPSYPRERLAMMIADSGITRLVGDRVSLAVLGDLQADLDILLIDDVGMESDAPFIVPVHPDQLAYVIYTSGSTGTPKGVGITHRNLARLFDATAARFRFEAADVWTQFHSSAFDFSVWEIFGALTSGGRLVIVPRSVAQNVEAFHELVCRESVTVLNQTPSAFGVFSHFDLAATTHPDALRLVIFGGEKLEPAMLAAWLEMRGARTPRMVNMYGITETTVHVTARDISLEAIRSGESRSLIGEALPDLSLQVMDATLGITPAGGAGELLVGGAGLARGYLGRPSLTAARFVPDPSGIGQRLYRSGDTARRTRDNEIEYLGRNDFQVKIRGYRIETGEIEAALLRHPAVSNAIVLAIRSSDESNRHLTAFVAADPASGDLGSELRAWIENRLPSYEVPQNITVMSALPLTSNGKLDRETLFGLSERHQTAPYQAPQTECEAALLNVWKLVLRKENIERNDNFFAVGGYSLLVPHLAAEVKKRLGIVVPFQTFFEKPVLWEQACFLSNAPDNTSVGIQKRPTDVTTVALAPMQRRLWQLWLRDPQDSALNIAGTLRFTGPLNLELFKDCLRDLSVRHEALRTVFRDDGDVVWQDVHSECVPEIMDLGMTDQPTFEKEASVATVSPFDLRKGALARWVIGTDSFGHTFLHFVVHHIISDAWSMDILLEDLAYLYRERQRGEQVAATALNFQYGDYAAYTASEEAGKRRTEQQVFWKDYLCDVDNPLPYRHSPAVSRTGGVIEESVGSSVVSDLEQLAAASDASLFSVIMMCFVVTLSRFGNQQTLGLSVTHAGRVVPGTEGITGFFVNLLPFVARISPDISVENIIRRLHADLNLVQAHSELPFDEIMSGLSPSTASPFSKIMLEFDGQSLVKLPEFTGIAVENITAARGDTQFDLTLSVTRGDGGLRLSWHYVTELLDSRTVRAMADEMARILKNARHGASIANLSASSGVTTVPSVPACPAVDIVDAILDAGHRNAAALALVNGTRHQTYEDFLARVAAYGFALQTSGAEIGEMIGVCVGDQFEEIAAMCGILMAGCAYVSLDSTQPPARLNDVMGRCDIRIVLADDTTNKSLLCGVKHVLQPQAVDETVVPSGYTGRNVHPDNPAYVVFTSGSTGVPKGVVVSRRGLALHVSEYLTWTKLTSRDVVLQFFATTFDASVEQIFPTLASGAALRTVEITQKTPEEISQAIIEDRVTVAALPTAFYREWVTSQPDQKCADTLRLVLVGGESLFDDDIDRWDASKCGTVSLANIYGPSEVTVGASAGVTSCDAEKTGAVSLGRPFAARRMSVRQYDGNEVPVGAEGELCVAGEGLAIGYLADARSTALAFVPDEHSDGGRVYRTGDLGRQNADRTFAFCGRKDRQIKLRGYRIEPGEIEAAIRVAPGIADVAVDLEQYGQTTALVAYVIPAEGHEIDPHGLDLSFLPEWMRPHKVRVVSVLPRLSNGKLDRSRLETIGQKGLPSSITSTAPATDTERTLLQIWKDVLGFDEIGVRDNFFNLGGDSILRMRVVALAREAGLKIKAADIVDHPTVAALAEIAVKQLKPDNRPQRGKELLLQDHVFELRGAFDDVEDCYPLTPLQAGILFHADLTPGQGLYVNQMTVRLKGELDVTALKSAWQSVVEKYALLRTVVREGKDGNYLQCVLSEARLAWCEHNWSARRGGEYLQALSEWQTSDRKVGFDVVNGPLMRLNLFRRGEADYDLVWTIHHAIIDGWGSASLLSEVVGNYRSLVAGEEPTGQKAFQYRTFVEWQLEQPDGKEWWGRHLSDLQEAQTLEGAIGRTSKPETGVQVITQMLEEELGQRIEEASRCFGVTAATLFQAAWALTIARFGNADVVKMGVTSSGREIPLEGIMTAPGLFVSTLPLVVSTRPMQSMKTWLANIQEQMMGLQDHSTTSLGDLQKWTGLSGDALFDSLFVFENYPLSKDLFNDKANGGLTIINVEGVEESHYPLSISVVMGEFPKVTWSYRRDIFSSPSIMRCIKHFACIIKIISKCSLESIVAHVTSAPDHHPQPPTVRSFDAVIGRIDARALERPDAVAVICEGEDADYRRLAGWSSQIGRRLHGLGVQA
ncbi:amino acid adenylation domain-containing protein, partial [Acetobacter persici]|uniref:amino acid adenylation domain-containing protein n=1 Tax=Acetobacter persici TaxID=1076596 RepID=UPI0036D8457D